MINDDDDNDITLDEIADALEEDYVPAAIIEPARPQVRPITDWRRFTQDLNAGRRLDLAADFFRPTQDVQAAPDTAWHFERTIPTPPYINLANHDPERRARAINCEHCNGSGWRRRIYGTWSNTEIWESATTRQADCPMEPSDERSDSEMWECNGCGRRPNDEIYARIEATVIPADIGEM